jgi:glutaredoxin
MPKDTRDATDVTSDPVTAASGKTAVLYRMALPDHLCPSGQKARWLLGRNGFDVDDRLFRERAEVDAFKAEHDVSTTPQIWIEGERVGGYDALRQKLTDHDPKATT